MVLGFKSDTAVLTFSFLTPSFTFLSSVFFFGWVFSGLHFDGKSFQESFQDLRIRLKERFMVS